MIDTMFHDSRGSLPFDARIVVVIIYELAMSLDRINRIDLLYLIIFHSYFYVLRWSFFNLVYYGTLNIYIYTWRSHA